MANVVLVTDRVRGSLAVSALVAVVGCGGDGALSPPDEGWPPTVAAPAPTASVGSPLDDPNFVLEGVIRLVESETGNEVDSSTATATRMTARDAIQTIESEGGSTGGGYTDQMLSPLDQSVWLVRAKGNFMGLPPLGTPGPRRTGTLLVIVLDNGFFAYTDIVYDQPQ